MDADTYRASVIARRKNSDGNVLEMHSPIHMKSPLHPVMRGTPSRSRPANDDEYTLENDDCFKSPPFMSPSSFLRRGDPSMSPYNDAYEDCSKSPSSAKMRQRIRPTPCFGNRRNSIQGTSSIGGSESDEPELRRPRLHSTSSTHSGYTPASIPQHQRAYQHQAANRTPSRVRTESSSFSIADAPFVRDSLAPPRRSHRSEEYQRVANAKREFNLKLNGKPPDRSSLTMYDLIYYNPLSNPMTKPASKGDKSSDSASLSSAKTNQTRKSVTSLKSEPPPKQPVKTEHAESMETPADPMPVPQLKLGANGEIVLDEKSLVIETTGDKVAREVLANSDIVYDDEFSGSKCNPKVITCFCLIEGITTNFILSFRVFCIASGFYKRQKRTRDWLPLETIKFYRSLQAIGTDFSVMLQLFPNRSRRDLKLKVSKLEWSVCSFQVILIVCVVAIFQFKKEEKYNMALINKALLHPKEFNIEELKFQFEKEDEEIELKKQEWAALRKRMAVDRK